MNLRQRGMSLKDVDKSTKYDVVDRQQRSFKHERDVQAMRLLSAYIFAMGKKTMGANDPEVEGMFINDRLVFASNKSMTLKSISNYFKDDELFDMFTSLEPSVTNSDRDNRVIGKVEFRTTTPTDSPIFNLLTGLMTEKVSDVIVNVSVEDKTALKAKKYEEKILFVHGAEFHAEQKLLYMVAKNGINTNTDIVIRGKKRPCLGCYIALRFMQEKAGYTKLNYNQNPGFYWENSLKSCREKVMTTAFAKGLKPQFVNAYMSTVAAEIENGTIRIHRSERIDSSATDKEYDSASDSDDELNYREDMSKRKLSRKAKSKQPTKKLRTQ